MQYNQWFKFTNKKTNNYLIALLKKSKLDYSIDKDGKIHYSSCDMIMFEDILCTIRQKIFPSSWQILSFPVEWETKYRQAIKKRKHPYQEEISNGNIKFLIDGNLKPHSWKID
jgi:hypothetical protein